MDGKNSLIFRKTNASIKKTVYNDFKTVISKLKLSSYFRIYKDSKIECSNGAVIDFSGLDDPERIKGISSYYRLYVDEISELEPTDFAQLRKRMRGIDNQKFLASFNPVSEQHWLKTELLDKRHFLSESPTIDGTELTTVADVKRCRNYMFIKSTYLNNFWVSGAPNGENWGFYDTQTIDDFEDDKEFDPNYYNVYGLGNWGRVTTGDEFYKAFRRKVHVGSFDVDEELDLYISVDENVRPFFPMTVTQLEDDYIKVCDEICGESPNNDVVSVCEIFANKYKDFKKHNIFVYGDATSRRQDARTEKGYNLFGIILTELEKHGFKNVKTKVSLSNPSVSMSGLFMNKVLAGRQSKILLIDESCTNTIADFTYLKEDADGTMLKERVRDKQTGLTWEKYGHCSDAVRYMVITLLRKEFDQINTKTSRFETFNILDSENSLAF
jgi:hypothetical protein